MAKRNQTPQGMSPATSLMGAARQFGKVGARGSGGNKSVNPGGKNKPVPGLSPQTNPRLLGKMPPGPNPDTGARIQSSTGTQPMIPSRPNNGGGLGGLRGGPGPAKMPGGAEKVGPQPVQRGQAKYDQSSAAPLTGRQRRIVHRGVRALKKSYEASSWPARQLRKGIRAKGTTPNEREALAHTHRAIRRTSGKKAAKRWTRRYRRAQG